MGRRPKANEAAALDGNISVPRLCLDRILPVRKDQPVT
jgi:hypothetical protein